MVAAKIDRAVERETGLRVRRSAWWEEGDSMFYRVWVRDAGRFTEEMDPRDQDSVAGAIGRIIERVRQSRMVIIRPSITTQK